MDEISSGEQGEIFLQKFYRKILFKKLLKNRIKPRFIQMDQTQMPTETETPVTTDLLPLPALAITLLKYNRIQNLLTS